MLQIDTKKINDLKAKQVIMGLKNLAPKLKSEYGAKIYLVGGFVRDYLLGKPGGDIDITVEYPHCDSKDRVDQDVAMFMINVAKYICDNLDYYVIDKKESKERNEPVYVKCKFKLPDALEEIKNKDDLPENIDDLGDIEGISNQGTLNITSMADNGDELQDGDEMDLDVVLSRSDNYDGRSEKCIIKPETYARDGFRRDFTINALGADFNNELKILDPTGKGIKDLLHKHILRSPVDPYRIFLNDPIRVLRTIRFKNRFKKPDGTNFDVDDRIQHVFENKGKMRNILNRFGKGSKTSYSRIAKEITKIMDNTNFGESLKDLKRLGVIDKLDRRLSRLIDKETVSLLDKVGDQLDEVEKLTVWFKDYDKIVQEQIDKKKLKKPIDILTIMKKMKYKDEMVDEVSRLIDALKLADTEFGDNIGDDKVKDIVKKLISRKHNVYVLKEQADEVWKNCKRFMDLITNIPQYKGYEDFYKRLEEMGGLDGLCEDILTSCITEDDLNTFGIVDAEEIRDVFADIEYIVKVLKPFNKRFSLNIDEAFIKSRLFDENEVTRWDIKDGKIYDEHGRCVSGICKGLEEKLNSIADELERLNMYKAASKVDNMVRMIKRGYTNVA